MIFVYIDLTYIPKQIFSPNVIEVQIYAGILLDDLMNMTASYSVRSYFVVLLSFENHVSLRSAFS